jgi:hypothetical protein
LRIRPDSEWEEHCHRKEEQERKDAALATAGEQPAQIPAQQGKGNAHEA